MPVAAAAPFGDDLGGSAGILVLLVVFLVGVGAGRAKARFVLLLAGPAAVLGVGVVLTGYDPTPAGVRESLVVMVPLVVAYAAGWFAARGTWLSRGIVVAVAVIALVAFPYEPVGEAVAGWLAG